MARARLGESPRELEQRYGVAEEVKECRQFTRCRYQKLSFVVEVYFLANKSVMEVFAKRGLGADEAAQLVAKVAGRPVAPVPPGLEQKIRKSSGISTRDEMFWSWAGPGPAAAVMAGFSPLECTAVFFGDPGIYAQVHRALAASK